MRRVTPNPKGEFQAGAANERQNLKLLVFDLDGVITTEAGYWEIARQGLNQILKPAADPLPVDFIYWIKNHAINHNWDVAFVALTAAAMGLDEFRRGREHLSGRELLASCDGYRKRPWSQVHEVCQAIQDSSPLPHAGLHSPAETLKLFETLAGRGFDFAVATGRPRPEALAPLDRLGIRKFFPDSRIVTHLEVERAERVAGVPLGKPHPFVALRAIDPDLPLDQLLRLPRVARPGVWFIGDTASDISAADAAGIVPIGILSALPDGPYREQRRRTLAGLGCDTILDSVLDLPRALELRK
jgi:phosphoglycolate phosphatase-like HAD superfamily hydrolase